LQTKTRFWFILPILLLSLFAHPAQANTLPATPAPDQCLLEPLEPQTVIEIVDAGFADPLPLQATRMAVPPEMIDRGTEVVEGSLACTNANQPLAALAAYTDRWLAERFSGNSGQDELGHLLAAATRSPSPAARPDQISLVAVENPIWYNGDRLGLMITTQNSDETFVDELIFIQTDGAWKIDQTITISGSRIATPPSS
jgi:hypothetical protein